MARAVRRRADRPLTSPAADGTVGRLQVQAAGMVFDAIAAGPDDGRPVVLLHGFPQTAWSWHRQLEALAGRGMRALAFDQRGYSPGARPSDLSAYRMEALVGDVVAVADTLGLGRFDLVGHDWGAIVAWASAGLHPDRIRSLTAVSVPHPAAFAHALGGGDPDQVSRSSYIEVFRRPGHVAEGILLGGDGEGEGLRAMFAASGMPAGQPEVEVFVEAMTDPGALTAALNWYRAADPAMGSSLGPVEVPTLFVWSTEDVAIGRAAAEACADWVSGPFRFEVLPGVSHWIPETAPRELNRLLLAHLQATG